MERELAEGLWTFDGGMIRFLTFPYRLRMTVVRLSDGSLFVCSPVELTDGLAREVDALGPVRHIATPNKQHHLFLDPWKRAYPDALLWAPPGLADKRDDFDFDGELRDRPDRAWGRDLDQRVVRGSWFMDEVVFLHRASRTLILGDLIENHEPRDLSPLRRAVARAGRMFGETPTAYRLTFSDKHRAGETLREVLDWRPERVVVAHGPIIERDVDATLRKAFAWATG
ncbi:MAG: DUF4336 domain-containing protein [Polyangiales bacterium]